MDFSSPEHARLALATSGWGFAAARFLLNTHWQEKYRLAGSHVLRRNGLIWEEGCLGQQVGCQSFAQGQLNLGPGHSSHQRKSVMNASNIVQASHPARRERAEKPQSEDPSTVSRRHYQKPRNRHFRSHVLLGSRKPLGQLYSKASQDVCPRSLRPTGTCYRRY